MITATQQDYWDRVAWEKQFTHPLDLELLNQHLSKDSEILDYGCGYGRTISELEKAGYTGAIGVDTSSEIIKRARSTLGGKKVQHITSARTPFADAAFDCVILFAVLTCVPKSDHQMELVKEIQRLLKPGGYFYISDYLTQPYKSEEGAYDKDGEFISSEGAAFRHHTIEYLNELLAGFDWISKSIVPVKTLSGSDAEAIQCLLQK